MNFSLSAKFNRFFIILGGVPIYGKNTSFWVKKPGVLSAFFHNFWGPDIRADGTPYTVGRVKIVDFGHIWVKITIFSEFCFMKQNYDQFLTV